jgi:hypothetical protein
MGRKRDLTRELLGGPSALQDVVSGVEALG